MIRAFLRLSFFLLAVLPALPSVAVHAATPVEIDRVIAVVNDDVITMRELRERLEQVSAQLREQQVQLPPADVMQRQVLERLILERAQLQQAKMRGLNPDEAMISRAIRRIAENNQLSEEQLRGALREEGIGWEAFRKQVATEIALSQLREQEVDSQIAISEAEVDNFIASNPEDTSNNEVQIAHILIRLPDSPSQADMEGASRKVDDIAHRLNDGETFSQIAAAYSDAPDALNGGLIDWRTLDRLPVLYAEIVRDLSPGEISPLLRSPAGLHIIQLVDRRGSDKNAPVEIQQTHVRHILLRTSEILSDRDAESRLLGLRERIEHGEDFAELARLNSADLSAADGGDIGWVNPGDTVPEFERAMSELATMEVSPPVKSPFGWHLIQVVERRMQDISQERRRNAARAALRERKGAEAYEEWLRRLRDETYVEYRLEEE